MKERMINIGQDTIDGAPRRSLFGRLAGAAAFGLAGLLPKTSSAQTAAPASDGPHWPGKLNGRHRQVVDGYQANAGSPLLYACTFLLTNESPGAAKAVVVLRAGALPIALNSAIWEKYKIGESLKIIDPETKAPAVKNPFLHPKSGVLQTDEMAVDWLLAKGAIFGACKMALHGLSKKLASNAGVSVDDAVKEWTANVVPGIIIIPSGTWGVNRAQEAGCTYCSGG
ncbi:MAG TPA: hypothetical protein VGL95_18055 [Acetobacteraceae bacterium]|jgi:hypothetical protein